MATTAPSNAAPALPAPTAGTTAPAVAKVDLTEEEILIKARLRANGLYAKDPNDPDKVVGFEDLKGLEVKDGLSQAMKMNSKFDRPSKNMQDVVRHPKDRHLLFQRPNGSGKTGAIALAVLRDLDYGPGTDYHQAVVLTNHSVNLKDMKETILRTGRYALGCVWACYEYANRREQTHNI